MKLLIVLLAVLAGVWLWQRGRRLTNQSPQDTPPRADAPAVQAMLRCARCDVHLPAAEAVAGRQGSYCCVSHRREAEGS